MGTTETRVARRIVEVVVIGAGQAGLATSYWLKRQGIQHVVLERNRVGHSWLAQRWTSFRLNTPNVANLLPGDDYQGSEPMGFASSETLVDYFEDYRERHRLPVEVGVTVTRVRRVGDGFLVEADGEGFSCRHVVVCGGDQNAPRIPAVADQIPEGIVSLHAADYRRAEELPAGAVLVVGAAQSGVQIVEDLLLAGRKVYLSTSAVARAPRRYRGKDIFVWMQMLGMTEQLRSQLDNPADVEARQPQISGTRGGHTVSLQQLARDGTILLGRLQAVRGRTIVVAGDLLDNVAKADAFSLRLRQGIDAFVAGQGLTVPPPVADPTEEPFEGMSAMASTRELDLDAAGVRSVIWATGFGPRLDYLDPRWLDATGRLRHEDGIGSESGVYCVGLCWQRRRASGLVLGVAADAQHVVDAIVQRR